MSSRTVSFLTGALAVSQLTPAGIDSGGLDSLALALTVTDSTPAAKTTVGGTREVTDVVFPADLGVKEIQTVTWTDFAGGAQGDYIVLANAAGLTYAFWIDKDDAGTQPTGVLYLAVAAGRRIRVDTTTGNTNTAIAAIFATAAAAMANVTIVDNADGTVTLTQTKVGNTTDPVPKSANDGTAGSILGSTGTAGVASNLNNKYFQLTTTAGVLHHFWFNVNSEGTDPAPAGSTGHAMAIVNSAAADTGVAAAAKTAIDLVTGFSSTRASATVTVTHAARSAVTDGSVGTLPAGGSLTVTTQGVTSTVSTTAETWTITAHGYLTGTKITGLTSTGTLPAGLATSTPYWIIVVDENTVQFAVSAAAAIAGTAINITDTGTEAAVHTATSTALSWAVKLQGTTDGTNYVDITSSSQTVSATGTIYWTSKDANFACMTAFMKVRPVLTVSAGQATASGTAYFVDKAA